MKKKSKISIRNLFMLTVAGIINAIGVTVFLNPVNLYDSGIFCYVLFSAVLYPA